MHTHSEEFFALAEQLAEVKVRFERVESEFATQAKPLESASVALGAVVEGLRAMKDHALGESIAAVAQKLEETRATIGEQIEVVVSGLQNADAQQSTATAEATAAFRAECAAIREQIGQIATQFGAEVSRVALEARTRAEQLEKTALAVGRDGADGKSVNPTGSYAADRAYNRLDIVSYMGGSYVSNVDGNREKPGAKSKNWTQLASRGAGGGITSVEGIPGINANVVGFLQTPTSANLRTAITDETGTGAAVFANTPTLVTPVLGAATGTSLDLSSNLTVTGAGLFGAATGGMPAAGVINATGFKINNVDVATSSDSFWSSVTGGINYGGGKVGVGMTPSNTLDVTGTLGTTGAAAFGGNVTLTSATASATLGTATETLAIAVTAVGAGTITTKAGQNLTIANGTSGALKATGTGAHVFGSTNTVTLSGGAITATGNIASSAATGTLTLGAATETLTIAATAAGAGTITTKAGQDLTIANGTSGAVKATGTGAHIFGTTNTVTLSAGAVTATATGAHTFGTTNTVTMAAGVLTATSTGTFGGNVTAPDYLLGTSGPSVKSSLGARGARQGLVGNGTSGSYSNVGTIGTSPITFGAACSIPASGTNCLFAISDLTTTPASAGSFSVYTYGTSLWVQLNAAVGHYLLGEVAGFVTAYAGKFVDIVAVRSSSGVVALYVNGVATSPAFTTGGASPPANWQATITGPYALFGITSVSSWYAGTILRPFLENRALSAAEVLSLYESGVPAAVDQYGGNSTELCTNGDFSSAAGWTLGDSGTQYTIGSGVATVAVSPDGGGGTALKRSLVTLAGRAYRVRYTVSGRTSGQVLIQVGNVNTAAKTADGTYDEVVTTVSAGTLLYVLNNLNVGATIDNIQVNQVGLLLAPDELAGGAGNTWAAAPGTSATITLPASGVSWAIPRASIYLGPTPAIASSLTTNATTGALTIASAGATTLAISSPVTISGVSATVASGTAIPAGGTAGTGVMVSSTANFGVFFGSGAPTLSAAKGSLYLRSDGTTTNDRAYICTGTTNWTALTTAS